MSIASHSLSEVVRVAEQATDESIESRVLSVIRSELDEEAKARVYARYDEGEISERATRLLLGDEGFEDAELMTEGADVVLSQDPGRYIS